MELETLTLSALSEEIERRVIDDPNHSYITVLTELTEELDVRHIDDMQKFLIPYLSPVILGKLKAEAERTNMLKERGTTIDLMSI